MAHVQPHWKQPSHPGVQEVHFGKEGFTTRSLSKVNLPPFALFANLSFPPCDVAERPTYATVQFGRNKHLNLNSDLLYINHSCEPSLIFDTGNFNVIAGPKGLRLGEELTFFYPSTEWHMAQPFDCLCGKPTCRGRISGARDMPREKLEGLWLNGHIREMLEERDNAVDGNGNKVMSENGAHTPPSRAFSDGETNVATPNSSDPTAIALKDALMHAEKVVESARNALQVYLEQQQQQQQQQANSMANQKCSSNSIAKSTTEDAITVDMPVKVVAGSEYRGVTSREMSGEMGGDTTVSAITH